MICVTSSTSSADSNSTGISTSLPRSLLMAARLIHYGNFPMFFFSKDGVLSSLTSSGSNIRKVEVVESHIPSKQKPVDLAEDRQLR